MRRWISFGLIVLVACVAAANLASPGAWASDSHAPFMTVPTRTAKPRNTPVPPEKVKEPTNTPASAPTSAPVVASPTRTATAAQPTKTATTAPQVTNTSAAQAGTVQPASTSTATPLEKVTATAAGPVETTPNRPLETTLAATSESASVATILSTPTIDGGASAASAAEQPGGSAPGSGVPGLWLLVVAVALMIFGGVLFFGRRAKDSDK